MCQLFVQSGIHFTNRQQLLAHIGEVMLAKKVVNADYPAALVAREAQYPTGIALERHAVAIPHCDAQYAISPAIYLIRPDNPLLFQRADEDSEIAVSLVMALIVTDTQAQMNLLRCLFTQLQNPPVIDELLAATQQNLGLLFRQKVLGTDYQIEHL